MQQDGRVWLALDDESFERPVFAGGEVHAAETIEELERELGFAAGSLSATVALYNRNAERGEDPLFHKAAEHLAPLRTPPFGDTDIGSLRFYGVEAPATTIFDLNGTWTDGPGRGPGPIITVLDRTIKVNMRAFNRDSALGSVIDDTHITVTFPDDATYTGQLLLPHTILWSNNSTWTKL